MRIRKHLTYANVMATIAVFGVVAGGGAYAASKIDTPDIANNAVTAKKLDKKAVKTSKLRARAVTGGKLADGAVEPRSLSQDVPLPLAGAHVASNGDVFAWINRINGQQPTVTRTELGEYHLRFPGLEAKFVRDDLLTSASLAGGEEPGEINTRFDSNRGDDPHPIVFTFDSNGNPADQVFTFFVYPAEGPIGVGQ